MGSTADDARFAVISNVLTNGDFNHANNREMLQRHVDAAPHLLARRVSSIYYASPGACEMTVQGSFMHMVTMYLALRKGFRDAVAWLSAHGVDVDGRDGKGLTALHRAVEAYCVKDAPAASCEFIGTAEILVELGADLDISHPTTKLPVLESAHMWLLGRNDDFARLAQRLKAAKAKAESEGRAVKRRRTSSSSAASSSAPAATTHGSTSTDVSPMLVTGFYSDVELVVGDRRFKAHKQVLSERCGFFRSMFDGNRFAESNASGVVLDEVGAEEFGVLLNAIYKGKVVGDEKVDAIALLHLVLRFEASVDIEELVAGIEEALTPANVLSVLKRAKADHCEQVVEACRAYVQGHHCDIVQQDGVEFDEDDHREIVRALRHAGKYRLLLSL